MKFGHRAAGSINPHKKAQDIRAGDLRNPVVLLRSERVPDSGTGFTQKLTPFHPAWAAMVEGEEERDQGENADNTSKFYFFIRNPHLDINTDTLLGWGDRLFKVRKTKQVGHFKEFIRLTCVEHTSVSSIEFAHGEVVDQTNAPISPTTHQAGFTGSPFWPVSEDPNS